ncbi:SH3 domain-containing protein [Leptospira sp. 2 VSF19]|uniref:SH3 domain-containing protein n=1 Tax=Leptospira soteropolitanensis TaxID=2950025 RepID=A0AAW5VJ77_9LEPT|nr:SH3 domain-containing protein [Leptospira soteropolitanensis]MCW7494378.1 SH3 domain-containing protein [Leptospira soteropolitanensis]MCW7501913.1 SH3 domain-containing protein [Leptospira soteropolitanensis]MCW7524224.1 SH3 domain-containing protein [Leptospira soteropolitanensis]MCW7528089.1 SH3 domain-containing protein [Leptospira soteropolitanensis]MCW7531943.1 SH3 domain-containing protein [Leptospira soteropolitanensis]
MSGYKTLLCILMILFVFPIFPENHWDNYIHEKNEGSTYLIFGDNVNLRESNNLNAKILKKLSIGESVKVLTKTNQTLEQNSVKEYWYKVQSEKDVGYIWGGLLADYSFEWNDKTILARNLGVRIGKLELKLFQNNQMLTYGTWDVGPMSNEGWNHTIYLPASFSPSPISVFGLRYLVFSEIEYGYTNEQIFTIDKDFKFVSQFSWNPGACDPPSCAESWLIFPNETLSADKKINRKATKGKPNSIIELTHSFDIDDESSHEYYQSEYIWNGTNFQKGK